MTDPATLLVEALAVGAGLVVLFFAVHVGFMAVFKQAAMGHGLLALQLFLVGALFHVICEFTGLNAYYCARRP